MSSTTKINLRIIFFNYPNLKNLNIQIISNFIIIKQYYKLLLSNVGRVAQSV